MSRAAQRRLAWGWILGVALLQHDFWAWDDPRIVLGFLPADLAWQLGISVAAALGWLLVVRWSWPEELEAWARREEA